MTGRGDDSVETHQPKRSSLLPRLLHRQHLVVREPGWMAGIAPKWTPGTLDRRVASFALCMWALKAPSPPSRISRWDRW